MPKWLTPVVTCTKCGKKVYEKNALWFGSKCYGRDCYEQLSAEEKAKLKELNPPPTPYKPKIEIKSSELTTITQIAKELGTTAVKLNKLLLKKGVLKKGQYWYEPLQNYKFLEDEGYIYLVCNELGATLKWTFKGKDWLVNFYKEDQKMVNIICASCGEDTSNLNCITLGKKFTEEISKGVSQEYQEKTFTCEHCGIMTVLKEKVGLPFISK